MAEKAMGVVVTLMSIDVVYLLCAAVNSLIQQNLLQSRMDKEKDIFKWLDLQDALAALPKDSRRKCRYAAIALIVLGYAFLVLCYC